MISTLITVGTILALCWAFAICGTLVEYCIAWCSNYQAQTDESYHYTPKTTAPKLEKAALYLAYAVVAPLIVPRLIIQSFFRGLKLVRLK